MRLICVSGIKGSGKTTLIKAMARRAAVLDKPSAVIANESGEESYEDGFTNDLKVPVQYLRGG
jgi:G3E family GTPase